MSIYLPEMVPDIDLGDDHYLTFTRWEPDDLSANHQWLGIPEGQPLPVVEKWGATVRHYRPDGTLCEGCITFDGEWQRRVHHINVERCRREGKPEPCDPCWKVESWEPLTVSPSLLCRAPVYDADGKKVGECNDHGFIRNGKWERA